MLETEGLRNMLPDVNSIEEGINVYKKIDMYEQMEQNCGMLALELKLIKNPENKRRNKASKYHNWTSSQMKDVITIAIKHRDKYSLTSSKMVTAILQDNDFKSNFYSIQIIILVPNIQEQQLMYVLKTISKSIKNHSNNAKIKNLQKLRYDFAALKNEEDIDELIKIIPVIVDVEELD